MNCKKEPKMHILIESDVHDDYNLQFFDYFYSYLQSINENITFEINPKTKTDSYQFKIFLIDPSQIKSKNHQQISKKYDIVLIGNGATEPLRWSEQETIDLIKKYQNFYLLIGSWLTRTHELFYKTFTFPSDLFNTKMLYFNNLYFTSFTFDLTRKKDKNIAFISGERGPVRTYLMTQVTPYCDTIVDRIGYKNSRDDNKKNSIGRNLDSFIQKCREMLGEHSNSALEYYDDFLNFGINNKFGSFPIGYDPIDEYRNHNMIVYSETTNFDDEFFMSEKTAKCLANFNHFLPYLGANCYKIFSDLGFRSILELAPDNINDLDQDLDHMTKIDKIKKACEYFQKNSSIFKSNEAKTILIDNYINYSSSNLNKESFDRFLNLIKSKKNNENNYLEQNELSALC